MSDWRSRAKCLGMPTEFWFPDYPVPSSVAAEIRDYCAGCPVRDDCLQEAIRSNIREGWWGGTAPQERIAMIRRGRRFA